MQVSVIMPVYNASKFIIGAVESVINLPQLGELIMIEDNSTDDSLTVCKKLEEKYNKIRLYQHENGINKGAGPSRNLGIKMAICDFISFLDVDDYYLPSRFEASEKILVGNPTIDGVYDAVGFFYKNNNIIGEDLTTIVKRPSGREVFKALLSPERGHFHTNGITIRKNSIKNMSWFREDLRLHQDTEFWMRLSYHLNLVPGRTTEAVAIRTVHADNRIHNADFSTKSILYTHLLEYFSNQPLRVMEKYYLARKFALFSVRKNCYKNILHFHIARIFEFLRAFLK